MGYYDFWYEKYKSLDKPFGFWDFIGTVREYSVPHYDLFGVYKRYFSDHPAELENRLSPELILYLDERRNGFNPRYSFMIGAKERIYLSGYVMVSYEIGDEYYNAFWDTPAMSNNHILRIPEDNRLGSMHILERVHILVCEFHQRQAYKE